MQRCHNHRRVKAAKPSEYSVQFIHRTFIFDLRDRVINQIPGEPIMPSGGGLDKKKEAKMRRRRRANALGVKVQTSEITFSLPPRAFTFAVHIHVHISPVHDQSPWFVSLTISTFFYR